MSAAPDDPAEAYVPDPAELLRASAPDGPDEMGRELAGGPDAVEGTLAEARRLRLALLPQLAAAHRLVLVGTGASLAVAHAAVPLWRRRLVEDGGTAELLVRQSAEAALGDADGLAFRPSDLVMAVSQSGTSPETLAAARRALAAGSSLLAITSQPQAPIAVQASLVLRLASGPERGAATASALATLSGLLAVAGVLRADPAGARAVAHGLRRIVASWQDAIPRGRLLAGTGRTWCLGFGAGLGIAEAAALLWHEKVTRPAAATTPSEFRHGPIEAARAGDGVVLVDVDAPDARRSAYQARLQAELARIGALLVVVPTEADEPALRALEALLRVQQLARATALAAGTYRDGFAVLRRIVTPADELLA